MKPVVKMICVLSLAALLAACGEKKEEPATGPVDAAPAAAPAAPAPVKEEPGGWVPPPANTAPAEAPAAAPAAEPAPAAAPAEPAK